MRRISFKSPVKKGPPIGVGLESLAILPSASGVSLLGSQVMLTYLHLAVRHRVLQAGQRLVEPPAEPRTIGEKKAADPDFAAQAFGVERLAALIGQHKLGQRLAGSS